MLKLKASGISLVLAALITVLSACSGGAKPATPSPTPTAPATSKEDPTPFDKRAPLRIGVLASLTGSQAFIGKLHANAVELARDEINAKGGIQGHPIQTIIENDEFSTPKAVTGAQKLITQDKVHVLNGPITSSGAAAVQPLTEPGIPHVLNSGSARALTEKGHEFFFRLTLADKYQTAKLVEIAVKDFSAKKIGILAESGSNGQGTIDSWTADLQKFNLKPIAIERFNDADVDFSSQIVKIKAAGPDLLVVAPISTAAGATLVRQISELGMKVPIFHSSTLAGSIDYAKLSKGKAEGAVGPASFLPTNTDAGVQAFVKAFQAKYNQVPEGKEAAQAYDVVTILGQYLNQKNADGTYKFALKFTDAALDADRKVIREALTTVKGFHGATGIEVNFCAAVTPECRDGIKEPLIVAIQGETWVPYKKK